jgi:hypothetical protein
VIPSVVMEPPKVKRTMMAQQALEVSDLLNMRFASMLVGQEPKKRLLVNAPDGPSTDGGKKARQSITIAPADNSGATVLMCGWIDVAQKKAELRTYRVVAEQSTQRYHRPFDVTMPEYESLTREANSLLTLQGYEVHVHDELAAAQQSSRPQPRASVAPDDEGEGGNKTLLVVLGVLLLVIAAVAAFVATR